MKPRWHEFTVRLRVHIGAQADRDYIKDAVHQSGGCHHPESPFFGLHTSDVRVRYSPKGKAKR